MISLPFIVDSEPELLIAVLSKVNTSAYLYLRQTSKWVNFFCRRYAKKLRHRVNGVIDLESNPDDLEMSGFFEIQAVKFVHPPKQHVPKILDEFSSKWKPLLKIWKRKLVHHGSWSTPDFIHVLQPRGYITAGSLIGLPVLDTLTTIIHCGLCYNFFSTFIPKVLFRAWGGSPLRPVLDIFEAVGTCIRNWKNNLWMGRIPFALRIIQIEKCPVSRHQTAETPEQILNFAANNVFQSDNLTVFPVHREVLCRKECRVLRAEVAVPTSRCSVRHVRMSKAVFWIEESDEEKLINCKLYLNFEGTVTNDMLCPTVIFDE